jgi:hypothetical protein
MVDLVNWYVLIPLVLSPGVWVFARQRRMADPVRVALVFFVIGTAVVLAIDLIVATI